MNATIDGPKMAAAYRECARETWFVTGYINFRLTESGGRWIEQELGIKEREIKRLMYEYVAAGGEIDEVRETRAEWKQHEFHHDLRFTIHDIPIYIEPA